MERKKIQVNSVLMRVILDPKNIKHVKGKSRLKRLSVPGTRLVFMGYRYSFRIDFGVSSAI